jgi:hypothetical protein
LVIAVAVYADSAFGLEEMEIHVLKGKELLVPSQRGGSTTLNLKESRRS